MLGNLLIGLREGLEASLIVSILVAYLVKTGRRSALVHVWTGVAIAVALSLGAGALLELTSRDMTFEQQELLGGTLSIVAVAFVTWMVFWMRGAARGIAGELRGRVDAALATGPLALVVVSFLAVGREGLETALILWAASDTATNGTTPLLGALLGILLAVAIGYLLYRGALRINLGTFFTVTGALLVLVAAGVLAYGVHDLQEAGFLPGLATKAFDVSGVIDPAGIVGTLLKGTLNFQPDPTVLQAVVWVLYVVPTMTLFLRPREQPRSPVVTGS